MCAACMLLLLLLLLSCTAVDVAAAEQHVEAYKPQLKYSSKPNLLISPLGDTSYHKM
jgi:hypothetical protein